MTFTDYAEDRSRPIVVGIDECAELFAAEPDADFEHAVADVLALLAPLTAAKEDQ